MVFSETRRKSTSNVALSSTALYTAYVWKKNRFTDLNLSQRKGFWFYQLLRPLNWLARVLKGIDLETVLVQRHRIIDAILSEEIESGRVKQVVEIAAGFSPRGTSFVAKYGVSHALVYVETDLPDQIALKRKVLLERSLIDESKHFFISLDAFNANAFSELSKALDRNAGTAVISEGFLNYFSTRDVSGLWQRIQSFLKVFPYGIYLADTQTHAESFDHPLARMISTLIEKVSKRAFHHHYSGAMELKWQLLGLGFTDVLVQSPQEFRGRLDIPGRSEREMVNVLSAKYEAQT